MIEIYHNPRCSKSRAGVQYLKDKGVEFKEILYMKEGISKKELKDVLSKLGMKPMDLIRTEEKIWKEEFKDKRLTDTQLIEVMAAHPNLIQRPIVLHDGKAVVARPAEKIDELF